VPSHQGQELGQSPEIANVQCLSLGKSSFMADHEDWRFEQLEEGASAVLKPSPFETTVMVTMERRR
jgi:hypothetical protein